MVTSAAIAELAVNPTSIVVANNLFIIAILINPIFSINFPLKSNYRDYKAKSHDFYTNVLKLKRNSF